LTPVIPDPAAIRGFPDAAAFERWLAEHHETVRELWLKIHKKDAGLPTVTYDEALDIALCWGWIDGQKKSFDAQSFLQRFTPRGPKSIWSQRNVGHIERLTSAGRMQAPGHAQVEAAKADGRWARAYAAASDMQVPDDLLAAIAGNPDAQRTFDRLNRQNRFALAFRLGSLKTEAGRKKRVVQYVDMLARGETIYPNGKDGAA
jgi:uncharacterized protein YdeI (YjbR/CyaY-like superfamily)